MQRIAELQQLIADFAKVKRVLELAKTVIRPLPVRNISSVSRPRPFRDTRSGRFVIRGNCWLSNVETPCVAAQNLRWSARGPEA